MAGGLIDFGVMFMVPVLGVLGNMIYTMSTRRSARQPIIPSPDGWYQLKMAPATRVTAALSITAGLLCAASLIFAPNATPADDWLFGLLAVVLIVPALLSQRRRLGFDDAGIRFRGGVLAPRDIRWQEADRLLTDAFSGAQLLTGAKSHAIGNHWVGFATLIAEAERHGVTVTPGLRATST